MPNETDLELEWNSKNDAGYSTMVLSISVMILCLLNILLINGFQLENISFLWDFKYNFNPRVCLLFPVLIFALAFMLFTTIEWLKGDTWTISLPYNIYLLKQLNEKIPDVLSENNIEYNIKYKHDSFGLKYPMFEISILEKVILLKIEKKNHENSKEKNLILTMEYIKPVNHSIALRIRDEISTMIGSWECIKECSSIQLERAKELLNNHELEPAEAALVAGSTLERFLKDWINALDLDLKDRKPCISAYAHALKSINLISPQIF